MQRRVEDEREILGLVPAVLDELFSPALRVKTRLRSDDDRGVDVVAEIDGKPLFIQAKTSPGPGVIDAAAKAMRDVTGHTDADRIALVVPYMTAAGAEAARERDLNWFDLSGNAHILGETYYVHVEGRPNRFTTRGRPSSPFAPKSARVTRLLLLDPARWWRQRELAAATGLNNGQVSRIVRALDRERLLEREARALRPRNPNLLLDSWSQGYRFDRHRIVSGHVTGSGLELAGTLHERLSSAGIRHAFTGLPAAWLHDRYAQFRLCSVYLDADPHAAAEVLGLRRNERGANVQLIRPDDEGVFDGGASRDGIPCVSPVQIYLDLQHLPERAEDAAVTLRERLWDDQS